MRLIMALLDLLPRWRLIFQGRVVADNSSRIRWRAIRTKPGCKVTVGRDSIVQCRIDFDASNGQVEIGDRCYVGASHLVCHLGIRLGDDVIISWGVTVVDHHSHSVDWAGRANDVANWKIGVKEWDRVKVSPVHIGDKVWIGFGAAVLAGVKVGEGAVIGAHSVVTRDVPAYTVVAGNPARVVRQLNAPDGRADLG